MAVRNDDDLMLVLVDAAAWVCRSDELATDAMIGELQRCQARCLHFGAMAMVSFVDETTAGQRGPAWHLEIFEESLPLREVIRRRVFQEVAEYNASGGDTFRGLVQPSDTERTLNGFRLRSPRRVDADEQAVRALDAFCRNGFIVLIDDRQVEDLDAVVDLRMGTQVTFLKLVPLVGG